MPAFELAPALESDADFLFETYKGTLGLYVEWAWGWDEAFQRKGFREHHAVTGFQLVLIGGGKAGALYAEENEQCRYLRLVFLLPQFQGQGIGSTLIGRELSLARQAGKPLELKVVKINPAKRFYERLGFAVASEDDATLRMSCT